MERRRLATEPAKNEEDRSSLAKIGRAISWLRRWPGGVSPSRGGGNDIGKIIGKTSAVAA